MTRHKTENSPALARERVVELWQGLPEKFRRGMVGTAFASIIELLNEQGSAPLSAVLEALFPETDPETARKALGTQVINRPPLSPTGKALLRVRCSRKAKGEKPAAGTVWFESEENLASVPLLPADNPRTNPDHFVSGEGVEKTGSELMQEARDGKVQAESAFKQAKRESILNGSSRQDGNRGRLTMRHGVDPEDFEIGGEAHLHYGTGFRESGSGRQGSQKPRHAAAEIAEDTEQVSDEHANHKPALTAMLEWAASTDPVTPRLLALLGDYGSGKTSHALQFTRVLSGEVEDTHWQSIKEDATQPKQAARAQRLTALFIDLAELAGISNLAALSLSDLLQVVLNKRDGADIGKAEVQALLARARSGELLIVFDGLDELLKNENQVLHNLYGQLLRVLEQRRGETNAARLIVSCRSHYFRNIEQQHGFFDTRKRGIASSEDYLTLTLLPWRSGLIESYLHKRLKDAQARTLLDILHTTYNLDELASRPVLLAMMSEQIKALLREVEEHGKVGAAQLYGITVAEWIGRDDGKHRIAPEHKPVLMGALAAALWDSGLEAWDADRLDPWLLRTVNSLFPARYPTASIANLQDDLRTATFIVRPDRQRFNFAHRSFMEYFLARFWCDALDLVVHETVPLAVVRELLPRRALNKEACDFLAELWQRDTTRLPSAHMQQRVDCLWRLLQHDEPGAGKAGTAADALHKTVFELVVALDLAGPAAPAPAIAKDVPLNLRGLDFSEQGWRDLNLQNLPLLDVRGTSFRGLIARRCRFGNLRCDADTNWSQALLRDCGTEGITWNESLRNGLLIRSGELPELSAPLPGPWSMPIASATFTSVAFSADERHLATAGADGKARVWELASGREVQLLRGHKNGVNSIAFSTDGCHLATAGRDGTARVWEWASGREVQMLRRQEDWLNSVAFSADGRHLVTASLDGTARVWEWAGGREVQVLLGHEDVLNSVTFSADGRLLATTGWDGTARVWEWVSGREVQVLRGHEIGVNSAAFSADVRHLATAGEDGTTRVWDWASGREVQVLRGHMSRVNSVAFSIDERHLATAGMDGTARVWDWASGREVLVLHGHEAGLKSVAFSADGRHLATAGLDGTVRLWSVDMDMAEAKHLPRIVRACRVMVPHPLGHHEPSWADFDNDGNLLACNSAAADHWLFRLRDGRSEPIEAAL